jgi:hypothetical protein
MITHSIARTLPHLKGWMAEYHLAGDNAPVRLCDAIGKPIPYPTAQQAYVAALEALVAAQERADAVFIDPHPEQFWLAVKPKTTAGHRLKIEKRHFKEGASA